MAVVTREVWSPVCFIVYSTVELNMGPCALHLSHSNLPSTMCTGTRVTYEGSIKVVSLAWMNLRWRALLLEKRWSYSTFTSANLSSLKLSSDQGFEDFFEWFLVERVCSCEFHSYAAANPLFQIIEAISNSWDFEDQVQNIINQLLPLPFWPPHRIK